MRVVIVHYHLLPGGVTTVIGSQIEAIRQAIPHAEIVLVTGLQPTANMAVNAKTDINSAFGYHSVFSSSIQFEELSGYMLRILRQYETGETVFHFHNPNLGKNPALTWAVYRLSEENHAVIDHCHDFAEDRPANMDLLQASLGMVTGLPLQTIFRPDCQKRHLVVLNNCDKKRIAGAGFPSERLHMVHNPVRIIEDMETESLDSLRKKICDVLGFPPHLPVITYPVRAIARKNIGELLLVAAMYEDRASFAITQPPKNPDEMNGYNRWKDFAIQRFQNVRFEAGEWVSYTDLIRISDFCITTSIREGFGMVYLEPFLFGVPVAGRELPCITDDLRRLGLRYSSLYPSLIVNHGRREVDFAGLPAEEQRAVIDRAMRSEDYRQQVEAVNPVLKNLLTPVSEEVMHSNINIIKDQFSLKQYGERLSEIYRAVLG